MNIKQLPSKYKLVKGEHLVEYSFQVEFPYVFTELRTLWEELLGDDISTLRLSDDKRTITYLEKPNCGKRAVKYGTDEIIFIFGDVVNFPSKVECPDKFKI